MNFVFFLYAKEIRKIVKSLHAVMLMRDGNEVLQYLFQGVWGLATQ